MLEETILGLTKRDGRPSLISKILYRVVDLGAPEGYESQAEDVNNKGDAVGGLITPAEDAGEQRISQGLLWDPAGKIQILTTLGGDYAAAAAINDSGLVVGISAPVGVAKNVYSAVIWDHKARIRDLGRPAGGFSVAYGVNNAGQVVGGWHSKVGVGEAVIWASTGVRQALGTLGGILSVAHAINNAGQVIGESTLNPNSSSATHAFLWESGKGMRDMGTLGAGLDSRARDINDSGQIVGFATVAAQQHAALWNPSRITDLGPGYAESINNLGEIVGGAVTSGGRHFAAIWLNERVCDLNRLIPDQSGWFLQGATSINDRGQIVGYGDHHGVRKAFLLSPLS